MSRFRTFHSSCRKMNRHSSGTQMISSRKKSSDARSLKNLSHRPWQPSRQRQAQVARQIARRLRDARSPPADRGAPGETPQPQICAAAFPCVASLEHSAPSGDSAAIGYRLPSSKLQLDLNKDLLPVQHQHHQPADQGVADRKRQRPQPRRVDMHQGPRLERLRHGHVRAHVNRRQR